MANYVIHIHTPVGEVISKPKDLSEAGAKQLAASLLASDTVTFQTQRGAFVAIPSGTLQNSVIAVCLSEDLPHASN